MIPPIPASVQDAYHRARQSLYFDQCTTHERAAIERYVTELEIRVEILTGDATLNATADERTQLRERFYAIGAEAFGISLAQYQGAPNACESLMASLRAREVETLAQTTAAERAEATVGQFARRNGEAYEVLRHHRHPRTSASTFKTRDKS